ncbi:hypothetical protein LCGC14_2141290 [marine sediment metagenome]|uniref:Uncharacterized protein n=1 Tax=marine sediment metagenome TaxID=412755 RepID=A0A0F9DYK2_9ZZZZ
MQLVSVDIKLLLENGPKTLDDIVYELGFKREAMIVALSKLQESGEVTSKLVETPDDLKWDVKRYYKLTENGGVAQSG